MMKKYDYRITLPEVRPMCSIFIADKNKMIVFAFRKLVENHTHLNIVGSSHSGLDALEQCRKICPALIIVDLYISDIGGLDFIRKAKRYLPKTKIIAYISHRDHDKIHELVKYGVNGIVDKSESNYVLLSAIHLVNNNCCFYSSLPNDKKNQESYLSMKNIFPHLSNREKQILKLIAEGIKNKEIALILFISSKTVDAHRFNIMRKLNAHNVVELVSWARKFNLI